MEEREQHSPQGTDICGAGRGARQPHKHGEEPPPRSAARVAPGKSPRPTRAGRYERENAVSGSPAKSRRWTRDGDIDVGCVHDTQTRSEEHTSELQSLMRISYAVFCLKKKN